MKFQFKIQGYQSRAVEDAVNVFRGQPSHAPTLFRHDLGTTRQQRIVMPGEDEGYRNADIELNDEQLLHNIREMQVANQIAPSEALTPGVGRLNLDVEMETGTGKTYVYIKTMFELNKRYGWSKFIVVVPSIAIREGVAKSFKMLEEHFMEHYGKKARWFVYNSANLHQLDMFAQDSGVAVMIINTQAFAASLKEDGRSKESRIIYSTCDDFGSRRPIDVIAVNRPIVIMDEPQKMEGDATQKALKKFQPLFVLNYSATHKTKHDTIYALDAYDAYREQLVKRIQVRGFEVKNLKGTSGYLYLDSFVLSPQHPPMVRLEMEVKNAAGVIRRELCTLGVNDSLRAESGLAEYEGFTLTEINPLGRGSVTFLNGETLHTGDVVGNKDEEVLQRLQIRETIVAHLEKERELFKRGIKCLSLFFIDEVANYRQYDDEGQPAKGKFQTIFEEEYARAVNDLLPTLDADYARYVNSFRADEVHQGYFSIDKRGRSVNSEVKKGGDNTSDDISAYDLILKNKERLLSFEEPTRFIFSHSALREGWDNPNIFQICTLRHSNSATAKRQEVGRGLRLCVDKDGVRQDKETLGADVHKVNLLTVIANESYADFTAALQRETREALRERTAVATADYFKGRKIKTLTGEVYEVTEKDANRIMVYLDDHDYIDDNGHLTQTYFDAVAAGTVAPYSEKLQPIAAGVTALIASIFNPKALEDMVVPKPSASADNKLNDNFRSAEFQKLWREINHKYVYTVHYNSAELIQKVIDELRAHLDVSRMQYVRVVGGQTSATDFGTTETVSRELTDVSTSTVAYDVVGEIARGARLTRRSVVAILQGIGDKLLLFRNNPEEFIRRNVVKTICEQKATMIVDHITYNQTDGTYDSELDTLFPGSVANPAKALPVLKHITPYIELDSDGERNFAHGLEISSDVVVYVRLPRRFHIPTPVGNYAPDWAVAFTEGSVRHVYFIAETKGSLREMDLRGVEKAKTQCAKQLFNKLSISKVRYGVVDKIENLKEIIQSVE